MYTPLNQCVFIAAYAGVMAGLAGGTRTPVDPTVSDDSGTAATAALFAESFDTAWGAIVQPDAIELLAIQGICQAAWTGRTQSPSNTTTAAQYTVWALGLIAEVQAASAWFVVNVGAVPASSCSPLPVALSGAASPISISYSQGAYRVMATRAVAVQVTVLHATAPLGAFLTVTLTGLDAHAVAFFDEAGPWLTTIPSGFQGTAVFQFNGTVWTLYSIGTSNGVAP